MENKELYKNEINNIFNSLEYLERYWQNNDNINFINNLLEYKNDVINYLNVLDTEGVEDNDR